MRRWGACQVYTYFVLSLGHVFQSAGADRQTELPGWLELKFSGLAFSADFIRFMLPMSTVSQIVGPRSLAGQRRLQLTLLASYPVNDVTISMNSRAVLCCHDACATAGLSLSLLLLYNISKLKAYG